MAVAASSTGPSGSGSPKNLPVIEAIVFLAGVGAIVGSCIGHTGAGYLPRGIVRLTESGERDPSFGDGGTARLENSLISPALDPDAAGGLVVELGPVGNAAQVCRPRSTLVLKVGSADAALDPQGRLLVAAAGSAAPEGRGNGYLLARFLLGPNA